MAVIPSQKFRFLGGEISPNLYNSADMDQYGRWFSKAENIRFETLGAFRNRTGFEKIAQTKVSNGETIKLLSFSFSRDENYLIEMGTGYFRFFKDGEPIYISGDPDNGIYEVAHTMRVTPNDIKYAQSGDVLYLVNGLDPVGTLTRNDQTGYNWTFDNFKFKDDCLPIGEENTDSTKTLSITNNSSYQETWTVNFNTRPGKYRNIILKINGTNYSTPTDQEYVYISGMKTALEYLLTQASISMSVFVNENSISFSRATNSPSVNNISIESMQWSPGSGPWIDAGGLPLSFSKASWSADGTTVITSTGHDFFSEKNISDVFAVNFEVTAESTTLNSASQTAVDSTSTIIKTNGKFGFATSGAWQGEIVLEYSLDGSTDWKIFRTLNSLNKGSPHNDNVAGTVSADADVVYMRIRITGALSHDTYPLNAYLFGEKFSANCYYKIVSITSATSAICVPVKNNFLVTTGQTISNLVAWREGSFSISKGYPSVVGIYQNRLLFAKEYIVYASKTNDFTNFYEPTTVIADDPITMSLLSNKYNRVKNLLTIRKFFVFTDEGEFGISSQGALTQTDKNLLPISYHGSAVCEPILAGNLALFVDFSGRVVRLFQYTYETDSFEATDASVFLEQLLKQKQLVNGVLTSRQIITTAYLKNEKEALFLDNFGTIWVFKLLPEQEVFAWSHWKYSDAGKITNICVVPKGSEEDLYIAVEDEDLGEKRIEKLSADSFVDSSKTYTDANALRRWFTDYNKGTSLVVDAGGSRYKVIVGENGLVEIPVPASSITCHYSYTSVGTLLSPTQTLTEDAHTTYNKKKPFKVHFCYQDSYGFKVGVEEEDKMLVRFNSGDRPETSDVKSGKRDVLIPAKYDGSSRVSFVQDRPYNMSINNVMIDMDYGGK